LNVEKKKNKLRENVTKKLTNEKKKKNMNKKNKQNSFFC